MSRSDTEAACRSRTSAARAPGKTDTGRAPPATPSGRLLRRPRGFGEGEDGSPEANGRLPSQGGARVRPAAGPDRAAHRFGAYLHLEVRSPWTSEASRRAHSMYRSASAGGMRDARIAGWAALATAATDATPTINARFGHGTVKTTMSAKYTM